MQEVVVEGVVVAVERKAIEIAEMAEAAVHSNSSSRNGSGGTYYIQK